MSNEQQLPNDIDVMAQAKALRQQTQVPNNEVKAHEIHGEISGAEPQSNN